MFARFLENAEVDGRPKASEVKTDSTSRLLTYTLPHFWNYATIDPGNKSGDGGREGGREEGCRREGERERERERERGEGEQG